MQSQKIKFKKQNSHSNRIFSVSKEKKSCCSKKIFGIKMKFKNTHN